MTAARREIPPSEQLWSLRQARDRYQALADQLRDGPGFEGPIEERRAQERDARRIAGAYEKSIANLIAGCRIRHVDLEVSASRRAARRFAIVAFLAALMAGAGYFAFPHLPKIRIGFAPPPGRGVLVTKNMGMAERSVPAPPHAASRPTPPVPSAGAPVAAAPAIRPAPRPEIFPTAETADPGSGFVVKVLQPDGSLQEEYFRARPAR